jgi:acyl carrier protein
LQLIRFVPPTEEEDMNSAAPARLRWIIAGHFRVKPSRIVDDTRFRDLGADWLDRLELLMVIEDQLPALQTGKLVVGDMETIGDLFRALEDFPAHRKRSALAN